ncbi:MAG: ABC transporter permease [Bacteroidetes bacterium]|nr:ABC transporter permease [Bacteroidota bacterium]
MLKIYFRTGLRNLLRHRSFSVINLIGLTLGLASIMTLAVMLYQFLTTNGQFANKSRMYYVKSRGKDGGESMQTTFPFLYEVLKGSPQVEAGTHIQSWYYPWLKAGDKEFQESTMFVDSGFFKVFSYPLEAGNAATAFQEKNSIVLSHEVAEKFFGKGDALGKTVVMDDTLLLTVRGVLEHTPTNTTFRPQVLLPVAILRDNKDFAGSADWYNGFAENYLLLKPGADTALLNAQMNQVVKTHYNKESRGMTMHVTPYSQYVQNESGSLVQVMIKGIVGMIVFILLVVIANLVNLNAATLFSRNKEVAVKKMMGGSKWHIIMQFCVENAILIVGSIVMAYVLFRSLLLPAVNTMIGDRFGSIAVNMRHDYPLALAFVFLGLIIVVIVGSYPAWYLNTLKLTDVVKGKLSRSHSKQYTRNVFITLQFVLAITFIGVTIVLSNQLGYMKGAALGFEKENVLVARMDLAYRNPKTAAARFDVLLNDLRNNPYVHGVSTSEDYPTAYSSNYNGYVDAGSGREQYFRHAYVDAGLLSTYKVPIIEGRDFVNSSDPSRQREIIINRQAVKMLGWKGPVVGRQLRAKGEGGAVYTVVGVMEDFHYQDLTRNIEPLMHHYAEKQQLGFSNLSVRVDPKHTKEVVSQLEAAFKDMPSRRSFSYEFVSNRISRQYTLLDGILKTTSYVAVLTVFIAAMGLFGLIALFTQQRVKEIGIRKVLGASAGRIAAMLSKNFVILVGVSMLIAGPISYFIMDRWLRDFAYRIEVEWWMLAAAGVVGCLIALVTVGWHAIRAAVANPVESLRNE